MGENLNGWMDALVEKEGGIMADVGIRAGQPERDSTTS